jgi:TonB family protein
LAHTGTGGDRPLPPYPTQALRRNLEGTIVLLLKADASGLITAIDVKETSCHEILNASTVEFVRRRWTLPPGDDGRIFQVAITYRLTSG